MSESRPRVALTFDAEHPDRPGASAGTVDRILATLRAAEAPATFFVQGRWSQAEPTSARRIADDGHLVGNHSHYHARMTLLSDAGSARTWRKRTRPCPRQPASRPDPGSDARSATGTTILASWACSAISATGTSHWHVVLEDWEPWRAAEDIAREAIDGAGRHGDGAVVLLHTWPDRTAEALPTIVDGLRAAGCGPRSARRASRGRPPVKRPALLAVDAGGSKIDAVLLRRDGNVLGAARRRGLDHDGTGRESFLERIADAVVAASRDAGFEPDHQPVAELGMYCVAGADLPADDRRIARWFRRRGLTRERRGSQRHVRGPSRRHRADVGRRRRVRIRDQLLGRRAQRPHVPIPSVRGAVGGLGRGPRHRERRSLVLGAGGGRARRADDASNARPTALRVHRARSS